MCVSYYGSTLDIIVISAIIFIAVLGDYLLKICDGDFLRAVIDSFTHGLIGLLSWIIVILHRENRYYKSEIICCGLLSSLIDIDHFFKAKSVRLRVSKQIFHY